MKPQPTIRELQRIIQAARGHAPCDLAIRGGYVVNVFTSEVTQADVGVAGEYIAVVAPPNGSIEARRIIDAEDLFLTPGLIDGHMHLESSMLGPVEFTRAALPRGTTSVVIDPHEIANVAGAEGVREIIRASEGLPLTFYLMISPAVPESGLVTSGGELNVDDIARLAGEERVLGIAEAMDFPGVIDSNPNVLAKLAAMPGRVVDGHAPCLAGRDLQAYAAAGITSEHEATNSWEGLEKLRAGMYLMIREGSAARDLDDLIELAGPNTLDRCLLVTDDLSPADLQNIGHMDNLLRRATRRGVSPAHAVRMATLNAAQRFGLGRLGAIAPGYAADIAVFEDLRDFRAAFVIAGGRLAAVDGEMAMELPERRFGDRLMHTVRLPRLTAESLAIPAGVGQARVIQATDGQIVTRQMLANPPVLSGRVAPDVDRDILKMVVVERHGRNGNVGLGLVRGFGLRSGAIASSVAHDSHNVIAVGTNDQDILTAIRRVGEVEGGLVAVDKSEVLAELPLPIGGLISPAPARIVAERLQQMEDAAHRLGSTMKQPFMTLSFMCLSVIPELKLTDKGLVEATAACVVPLFTGEQDESEHAVAG